MRKTADRPNESAVVVDWIKNTVDAIQRIQDIDGIKQLQHNLRDQISIANDHSLKRKTVISNEVDYELEYLISQISKLSIEETKTVEKEASIMDTVINAVNISEKKKFKFKNGVNIEISSNLIMNHPTSVFYRNAASSGSEQSKDVISIDIRTKYIEKIVKYMEKELNIWEFSDEEFADFCDELVAMELLFDKDICCRLFNSMEYGIGWKNRCVIAKENQDSTLFDQLNLKYHQIEYNEDSCRIECPMDSRYEKLLQAFSEYLKGTLTDLSSLKKEWSPSFIEEFLKNYQVLDSSNEKSCQFFTTLYPPLPKERIHIQEYQKYIWKWIGNERLKLIYKASEHNYTAESFHEYCDDQGPTLVVIRSIDGWIFGGFTTQSWKATGMLFSFIDNVIEQYKYDVDAFIFTLKNPHSTLPTHFKIKSPKEYAIICSAEYGPLFTSAIYIGNKCNTPGNCFIRNDGMAGYCCDSMYKCSLYVNSNMPNEPNAFIVDDYEVYCIDLEAKRKIYSTCKHPNLIWEYLQTNTISDMTLDKVTNKEEVLKDFDLIQCTDSSIREKVTNYVKMSPSHFLSHSQIVDKQYDDLLKTWIGDYEWKMIYRVSEHGYTSDSFHQFCNWIKGPTLVVIKSSEGWIFGGYTTKSWMPSSSSTDTYKEDLNAFIFTLKNPHGVPPMRFNRRKDVEYAIRCHPQYGPVFGTHCYQDICIGNYCDHPNSCYIDNDGQLAYMCHPQYRMSLFVNTNSPNDTNHFSVLDYEVFCIDYCSQYTINKLCKYSDVIWEYIQTRSISNKVLNQIDDDVGLLKDLACSHCDDTNYYIRLKILTHLKEPSAFLPGSKIVDKKYDGKLKEWLGNNTKWKLIYRASNHGYTAESFHSFCDGKGPTLIVIKSIGGWIFGGYTTQSWGGDTTKYDPTAFLFTLKNPHFTEPLRLKKKKNMKNSIFSTPNCGPIFGSQFDANLYISNNCSMINNSYIYCDKDSEYEYNQTYQSSLFVNSNEMQSTNRFTVLDYEVYLMNM